MQVSMSLVETLSMIEAGFSNLFTNPTTLLLMAFGCFVGIVMGAIPGLTGSLALTLLLPVTYVMKASQGISFLIAIYVGGVSGGLVSAILINIPGSPCNIATVFDGHPMAKKGQAGLALSLGVFCSFLGGLISCAALILIAPQLATFALKFSNWEYFAMGVMGLCVVISLCSKDIIKGSMSAVIGIVLSMVGMDALSSIPRFTFGFWQLDGGLANMAVLMALFAYTEILSQLQTNRGKAEVYKVDKTYIIPPRSAMKGNGKLIAIGSVLGTLIGILPGVGQSTASLVTYNVSRQVSKNPEKFGTGTPEGIIGCETANNAVCGGALIPMMTMGIPGDMATAILLGGLIVHGLQPGALLFKNNPDVVGAVYVAYFVSCIMMFLLFAVLMRLFVRIIAVPLHFLFPVLFIMCMIGAYASSNRVFDCWVLFVLGVVGYILLRNGFSLAPMVLGYILGPIIERRFRLAILANSGAWISIFTRPIAMVLLLIGVLLLVIPKILAARSNKKVTVESVVD